MSSSPVGGAGGSGASQVPGLGASPSPSPSAGLGGLGDGGVGTTPVAAGGDTISKLQQGSSLGGGSNPLMQLIQSLMKNGQGGNPLGGNFV